MPFPAVVYLHSLQGGKELALNIRRAPFDAWPLFSVSTMVWGSVKGDTVSIAVCLSAVPSHSRLVFQKWVQPAGEMKGAHQLPPSTVPCTKPLSLDRPHRCQHCSAAFVQFCSLKIHTASVHGAKVQAAYPESSRPESSVGNHGDRTGDEDKGKARHTMGGGCYSFSEFVQENPLLISLSFSLHLCIFILYSMQGESF